MGYALEHLSFGARQEIAMRIITAPRLERGAIIWGVCPYHAEGTPGNSFNYDVGKDVAFCFSCHGTGDLIDLWAMSEGRDARDKEVFKDFARRYGRDEGYPRPASAAAPPRPVNAVPSWTPEPVRTPAGQWQAKAAEFVRHSVARLAQNEGARKMLKRWGLKDGTIRACGIGWNDRDKYPPASGWGFPEEVKADGKPVKLSLPQGLVFPWARLGQTLRVQVRRDEAGNQPRYHHVRGGSNVMYMFGHANMRAWVVVETVRDAALCWQETHGLGMGAVAVCSASARPDAETHAVLQRAEIILVALDTDQAGAANKKFWADTYPQSLRWPVPPRYGKDPGEAVGRGMDVSGWLSAGIPDHAAAEILKQRKDEYLLKVRFNDLVKSYAMGVSPDGRGGVVVAEGSASQGIIAEVTAAAARPELLPAVYAGRYLPGRMSDSRPYNLVR